VIRAATRGDLPAIVALEAAGAHAPWSEQQIISALERGLALLFGDPICGHILCAMPPGDAEIWTVVVHPSARRRGIAQQLLHAAEAAWRERGATEAFLEVREDNAPAIHLYQRHGWEEVGRRRRYYRDGTDALVMRLELSPPRT